MQHAPSITQKNWITGLALPALGVVFGDIGTSPLYTLRECLHASGHAPVEPVVLGLLSLIFWTVVFVVSIKYVLFIMRADNQGEGGIIAKRREKLSRVLGKRALKTFHPRSFNARLLAGVTWSDQSGTHCRTAAPAFC